MTKKSEVKLLGGWQSPYSLRARLALNVKSVEYEFIQETFNPKSQLLIESNPIYKKVPVLIHRDKPICESLVIVEYVDEVWPFATPILPSDPYDRANARFWATYIDDKWYPALKAIRTAKGEEEKKKRTQEAREGMSLMEDVFQKSSKGKDFFGGDQIGFLDITFGCFLGWLRVTQISNGVKLLDHDNTPGLVKWAERFCSHDAVKHVMPETGKLHEFAKILWAKMDASAPK